MLITTLERYEVESMYELLDYAPYDRAARVAFKEEFEAWCEEEGEPADDASWDDFSKCMHETFDCDSDFLEQLMPVYIEQQKLRCADWTWDSIYDGDGYVICILQAEPQDLKDVQDMIALYMKARGNEELAEVVAEALIPHESAPGGIPA